MEKEAKINALFWMLPVGVGFVAALILPFVIGTLDKARDKEVAMMLSTIAFAQEAYMKEYGKYGTSLESLGLGSQSRSNYEVYLSRKEMPNDVLELLKPDEVPFILEKDYQLLAVDKNRTQIYMLLRGQEMRTRKFKNK